MCILDSFLIMIIFIIMLQVTGFVPTNGLNSINATLMKILQSQTQYHSYTTIATAMVYLCFITF